VSARLRRLAGIAPLEVLRQLDSSLHGLVESEAQARLARHGENSLPPPPRTSRPVRLLRALADPFVLTLLGLGSVSAGTGDLRAAAVIGTLALTGGALRVAQEHRAGRAAPALRATLATTTTVLRQASAGAPPVPREVPTDQLVPGDVVRLAGGDLVPADVRLLRSTDLAVSQAFLTGKSAPALKHATLAATADDGYPDGTLFDHPRLCLLGSMVVGGSATGVVVATGTATYFGASHRDHPHRRGETTFERGVKGVSWNLIRFTLATVPLVLAVNMMSRGNWLQGCLFAVAVAVGLTPEMLPVVVTGALIRGGAVMRRSGVIVKRLPAIHNLGAMDVLCIDKTGTLTHDRISVASSLDPLGRTDPETLRYAFLNSRFGTELLVDAVDEALVRRAEELGLAGDERYTGVQALGFDAVRRRATVAVRETGRWGVELLITKGAAEEVLSCCTGVHLDGSTVPLDAALRAELTRRADALHTDGVRVLAVAVRTRRAGRRPLRAADEAGLTLVGYLALLDEIKDSARQTLAELAEHGTHVKVVTGDHPLVAARICRDAGLDPGVPVQGFQVDALDDPQLAALARGTTVFARVDPQQKARIVTALRLAGQTVGYVGDGVNDAPALRAADVGICVDAAVDVARESSDVLLMRKDLAALTAAILAGRRAFGNIIKYLKITVSSNVGNVCAVLAACAALPFLPLLPVQILVQNLLFDIAQLALAFDHAPADSDRRPRTFDRDDLARFVVWFGLINMVADLATFAALRHALGNSVSPGGQVLFHTGWFVENLLTQALAVHLLRGPGRSGWSPAARPVIAASIALVVLCVVVPVSPVGAALGLRALPMAWYAWLLTILAAFAVAMLAGKRLYRRVYHAWL